MNDSKISAIPRRIIDTNIIIRYLVGDGADHALQARNLFQSATDGKVILIIPEIVFIEVVHVLKSYYKINKHEIANALYALIHLPGVETTTSIQILIQGLENFKTINAPWPDALIAAYAYDLQLEIYSFDQHFDKFEGVTKIIPS